MQQINIFWFRRDLRLHDNAGLYHALRSGKPVLCLFIFDKDILDKLEDKADKRVAFIYRNIIRLKEELNAMGSSILVRYGSPAEVFESLQNEYAIASVFTNHDYEPYAKQRDQAIKNLLDGNNISFQTFKDQVIFEKAEVTKDDGLPYTVFTPYSKKWLAKVNEFYLRSYPTGKYFQNFFPANSMSYPSLESMGFTDPGSDFPPLKANEDLIREYDKNRNFPGISGTSKLGVHLRFGTISIRELARKARELNSTFLNELIWREFYQAILWHFPQVGQGRAFKPAYENIRWRNNEKDFERWTEGQTGYPIVDAGMRELNSTGFMHNRVRMIVASFLVKHLLIDWRWGEAYFAGKLLDFDLASNNGGWQWAAGSGCDAAPYFRIFNPSLQAEKFDRAGSYVKRWVPGADTDAYPEPMVEHAFARNRAIAVFKESLENGSR